ncbi:MAG TPA: ATP-binding protein [Saprospiraceae bacterium]|nr:ATP-binding protein [Saprospiraceae bacterium]HMQ82861.1 ATP-binding protein [Saprospiraceae bacterium]
MRITIAIPIFLCLLPLFAFAQKANLQFYTTQDGLSGSYTQSIAQDRQGFLWVFNDYKLHRFDGRRFELYTPPAELSTADDRLTGAFIYRDSFLAFFGKKNLFLLNTETANWLAYPLPIEDSGTETAAFPTNNYWRDQLPILVKYKNWERWELWSFSDGQFSPALPHQSSSMNDPFSLLGADGHLYLYPNPYLLRFRDNPEIEVWSLKDKSTRTFQGALEGSGILRVNQLKNGQLSVLLRIDDGNQGHTQLQLMDMPSGKTTPHPANRFLKNLTAYLTNQLPLENGDYWFCGIDRQLYFYNFQKDTLIDFSPNLKSFIPNNTDIMYGFEDKNGTVWFGTRLGLLKASLQESAFEHFFDKPLEICGGDCSFRGMTEDAQGNLYASFYHGIVQFTPKGGNPKFFTPTPYQLLPLPSNLHADGQGLWLNNGMLMDTQTGIVSPLSGTNPNYFGESGFLDKSKDGHLWWANYHTLFYRHDVGEELRWEKALDLPHQGDEYATEALYVGKKTGFVYVSQLGRLLQFDPKSKKDTWFDLRELNMPISRILAIEEDTDGLLWLATDVGLVRYDPQNQHVKLFTTDDGLPNNFVCGILAQGDSCLWLSTNHGLSRFHIASESFINFYEEDGLTHNEFNRKSYFKAKDGRMYFGGLRGLNAFYPDELMNNLRRQNEAAQVAFSSFEYVDEKKDSTFRQLDFPSAPVIHLYHWHRSFTFEYVLTDFRNPTEVTYSYQMEGYEDVWSTPSKFNFTRFSSLPPGEYVFRVKAKDSHGLWHPNQLEVQVIVHPPWWRTWWAYLTYTLLFGGTAFSIFSFLKKRWKLQNDLKMEQAEATRLKELDSFKSRLYTNLTHEFRTPLTVILGMAGQIKNNPDKYLQSGTRLIESNGHNLLKLINQLLDLSKLEDKLFKLNLQQGDVVSYLRYVTESFQTYANSHNLSLRFFTTFEKLDMDFDPEQIKQVMTNLISNAVKFTPSGGEVKVLLNSRSGDKLPNGSSEVQEFGSTLAITVTDTGIGIPTKDLPHIFDRFYQADGSHTRKGEGTGIGLAHTLELVKLMGGTISAESELGKGTTFQVVLPITRNAVEGKNNMAIEASPEVLSGHDATLVHIPQKPDISLQNAPSLLIIEDNPDVVVYIKSCLEGLYQLDVAYNGKIGIEKALEHIPDLIVCDVMMPEKDGYEVCDFLKHDERTSHIPVVLLTAKADTASKIAGLRRGADTYLAKPFDKEELLVWLEKLLERQQRVAAYFAKKINGTEQGSLAEMDIQEAIEVEDAFIQKVRQIVADNFDDEGFALPQLCQKIGMSRSQLFRKMKALIDESPSDFIRNYRLTEAKKLLETTDLNVSEVAWKVGYKYLAHFSNSYQEFFGEPPSATK